MALFRFHRGGLADSLKTTIIVKNREELRNAVKQAVTEMYFIESPDDFKLEIFPYPLEDKNFDPRIGWFTQMVTLQVKNINAAPVGFLSEPLDD
jgi:hypothetical protein